MLLRDIEGVSTVGVGIGVLVGSGGEIGAGVGVGVGAGLGFHQLLIFSSIGPIYDTAFKAGVAVFLRNSAVGFGFGNSPRAIAIFICSR